jgi:hypothetical protein
MMEIGRGYLAVDQYGTSYFIGNNPPRKWLLDYFGKKHASKIYTGKSEHIGWVIAGHWLAVYKVGRLGDKA